MMFNPSLKNEAELANATSYAQWSQAAQALDRRDGSQDWRSSDDSPHFDYKSIRRRLETLAELRAADDNTGLLYTLNEGIHGNMDGMANDRLYHVAKFGTKQLIHDYVDAIVEAIEHIASANVTDISFDEKRDFLRRAHHCYGCSALLMSGSGAFLFFHAGVVKALWSEGVLPSIISGSSGGSIIGALVCTRTDDELEPYFDPEFLARDHEAESGETAFNLFGTSKRMGQEQVRARLAEIIPDITFQEAYEITGRHLNVSVAPAEKHQNGRLLNAIASPNVYIREAVLASCAVPGIYDPVELMAKDHEGKRVPYLPGRKWVDGSVTHDLPAKRLSRLYGVNHHIVSQANPLVTPFASDVTQLPSAFNSIRRASVSTLKAWLNVNMQLWEKPLSLFPQVQRLANLSMSVINQEYSGDINIVRPMMFWSPSKILSNLSIDDISALIESGERSTWPEVERVRAQTKISQTLDRILAHYEQADASAQADKKAMKRKIA